jgi:hypothetical protein
MTNTTVRLARWEMMARVLAPLAAFLLVGTLVLGTSRAAFFATTDSTGNSLAAGDVLLSDDDSASAMFAVTNMAPGSTAVKCINVQYDGSIAPADVVLYVAAGDLAGTGLDDYLNMTVEVGSGGGFADCSGFTGTSVYSGTLDGFAAGFTDFASGTGSWIATSTGDDRTYRFSFELQDDNAAQAKTATVDFTWEAQNQ